MTNMSEFMVSFVWLVGLSSFEPGSNKVLEPGKQVPRQVRQERRGSLEIRKYKPDILASQLQRALVSGTWTETKKCIMVDYP